MTRGENLLGLMAVNREMLAQAGMPTRAGRIVLDMDSSESPVHGAQEGSAYNGHFESVCYHPLFLFNEHGDCVAATLRPGNVHSADDWADLLLPEIERQHAEGTRVAFRADAAFAKPEIYDALEQRDVDYAIRMPANKNLELEIEDILFRPPGRQGCKPLVRYKPGFPFWTSRPSPLYTQNLLPGPICCCGPLGMPSKPSAGCARRSRRANRRGSGTFLRHLPHIAPCRRPRSRDAIGRQPAGTGSAQIRWSIAPNSRRVRWLSASRSQ